MRKLIILLLISCSTTFLFGQQNGTLSDAEISFTFVSKNVNGSLSGFKSKSIIDKNDKANSKLKGSVLAKTLDSGNFLRNWSLKGGKYFDVDTYPTISFESTSVKEENEGFVVDGLLTIKDISKPLSITFKEEGNRLVGTATLYSSDFDIQIIKKSREANKVIIKMSFKVN